MSELLKKARGRRRVCSPKHLWGLKTYKSLDSQQERRASVLLRVLMALLCWGCGGPGGTSWLGSTGGSGVRQSNCSRLIKWTFLKFSTSCCDKEDKLVLKPLNSIISQPPHPRGLKTPGLKMTTTPARTHRPRS